MRIRHATMAEPATVPTGRQEHGSRAAANAQDSGSGGSAPRGAASGAEGEANNAGIQLIRIEGEVRRCKTREMLWQHLANEPVALLPFGQALVLEAHGGDAAQRPAGGRGNKRSRWTTVAVSGMTRVNRDAPMIRWYENIVRSLWSEGNVARDICAFELPEHADPDDPCTADAALRHLLWVPLADVDQPVRAGWLLARSAPWEDAHHKLAARLAGAYAHADSALAGRAKPAPAWRRHQYRLALAAIALVALLALVRVPLTTLAPVEVTPQEPFVVAAPVAAVVERILVAPGAQVAQGAALVQLVDTTLRSDFEVADQKVEVARAKTLRLQQASVEDSTAKRDLAIAQTEESVAMAERDYARAMLDKSVSASYDRLDTSVERQLLSMDAVAHRAEAVSSLRLGDGLALEFMAGRQQVSLALSSGEPVREVRATLADGRPLPPWMHMDSRGFLLIDRPAGVEQVRLRLTVVKQSGATLTHTIEIDFNSGELKQLPARGGGSTRAGLDGGGRGAAALASGPALDFVAQLERAAERTSESDAQLLRVLEEVG